jgi:hypothetical protein
MQGLFQWKASQLSRHLHPTTAMGRGLIGTTIADPRERRYQGARTTASVALMPSWVSANLLRCTNYD